MKLRHHLLALCALLAPSLAPAAEPEFLDVDAAFALTASATPDGAASLHFRIAPDYHLYRERLSVETLPAALTLAPLDLPPGAPRYDANFGREMELYHGEIALQARLAAAPAAAGPALLRVNYQGCAEAGLCYPPQTRDLRMTLAADGRVLALTPASEAEVAALENAASAAPVMPAAATASATAPAVAVAAPAAAEAGGDAGIGAALRGGHLLTIAGVFLLAGLLLSFTPCVLPMVPILSSIIVGQSGTVSRSRGFSLALAYSLGMALTYTAFGVVAGLIGEGLASALQNPWVLGSFATLMALLSLSMFGVYELQMPSFIQTRLTLASGQLRGGNHAGVFVMGALSALIVGPCVAAPLAGALVYISQTRDVLIGGLALFSLAAGMSVPLLLVGLSAGTLLPRAGRWMISVKTAMGMLLLGVAWWMVTPVMPAAASLIVLGAWFALAAALMGAFTPLAPADGIGRSALKAAGVLCACVAVAQVVGALAGADSPLQPLRPLAARTLEAPRGAPAEGLAFARVSSSQELDARLAQAGPQPVMLDFYADWCTSCKELEHATFSDARVQARLDGVQLLQVDLSDNGAEQKALLRRFQLFGPPAILMFKGGAAESGRVIGFQNAEQFLQSLGRAGL